MFAALVTAVLLAGPTDPVPTLRFAPERPDIAFLPRAAFVPEARGELRVVRTAATSDLPSAVWEGSIEGDPGSLVLEVRTSVGPFVSIRSDRFGSVQIVPIAPGGGPFGSRLVREAGPELPCGGAIDPATEGAVEAPGGLAGTCDGPERVDVLMRWTPRAEEQAGGPVAIRAIAEASVAISNHVYATSGIPLRMRAVDYGPTGPYDNDAGSGVLSQLRVNGDGILDEVHADRDRLGADLVALLTGSHPSYCGVAYLISSGGAAFGFSVTVWSCAAGNLTFTHEIGHNQGCCHAPGDGGGCVSGGIYPYSVGYRYVGDSGTQWRSTMAYAPGTRWPRFSSPTVVHDGQPFGVPGPDGPDNARTVAETAAALANFRCTSVPETDPSIRIDSGPRAVPIRGASLDFEATGVPRARPDATVELELFALADLGQSGEHLSLALGGLPLGIVLGTTGSDCRPAAAGVSIDGATFNALLAGGSDLAISIAASAAVDPICAGTELRLVVRYPVATVNGDLDGDGRVASGDLALLLAAWGACPTCPSDLDGDGAVGASDLALLLGAWTG